MLTFILIYLSGVLVAAIIMHWSHGDISRSIWLSWIVPAVLLLLATAFFVGVHFSDLIDRIERDKTDDYD